MREFSVFSFESCRLDPIAKRIDLTYCLDEEIRFTETIQLPGDLELVVTPEVERALFALHLAGGVSYYKTCLPPQMRIRSGSLSPEQAAFWTTVYERGLGEFFYQNNIDGRGRFRFPADEQGNPPQAPAVFATPQLRPQTFLVPVGGGKDSIVTIELLKSIGARCTLFRVGSHPIISAVAETSGLPLLTVERRLDPRLFALNAEGALNGHVPVTAYISFLTVLVSLLYGFDFVAMSNERSASEGNVQYHGAEVNHQWSKSLDFEAAFVRYVAESISSKVGYASLLRPLSELHIAGLFARFPQYFDRATSCNRNWKLARDAAGQPLGQERLIARNRWCGNCPKCAFSFVMLAAFLPRQTVVEMFGQDLLANDELIPLYRELLGIEGFKPFECVGTTEETQAAFLMADRDSSDTSPILNMFRSSVLPHMCDPMSSIRSLLEPAPDHLVPTEIYDRLQEHWEVRP